jgi:hypothetical protein
MILDIACIVFIAVTANHLGLMGKIGEIMGFRIPILNCPKCLTFWATMGYLGCHGMATYPMGSWVITMLAISFLASYTAIWLELAEGYIDFLYMKCYEKIYADAANDEDSADGNEGDTDCTLSELQENIN